MKKILCKKNELGLVFMSQHTSDLTQSCHDSDECLSQLSSLLLALLPRKSPGWLAVLGRSFVSKPALLRTLLETGPVQHLGKP